MVNLDTRTVFVTVQLVVLWHLFNNEFGQDEVSQPVADEWMLWLPFRALAWCAVVLFLLHVLYATLCWSVINHSHLNNSQGTFCQRFCLLQGDLIFAWWKPALIVFIISQAIITFYYFAVTLKKNSSSWEHVNTTFSIYVVVLTIVTAVCL